MTDTPRKSSGWPMATVFITLIAVMGIPMCYLMIRAVTAPARLVNSVSQALAEAARPKLSVNEIVQNSITDLHKEAKFVVLTTDISTDVTREEGESSWGVYWGTNVARISVRNAKVQYVIDMDKLETSDFVFNEQAKVLSLSLPRPHVDTGMVAIDPAQIQTLDLRGGWARFDKQETRNRALAELKPKVLTQAQASYVREIADSRGIDATTKLMQPVVDMLNRDGVMLRVAYRD